MNKGGVEGGRGIMYQKHVPQILKDLGPKDSWCHL